MGQFFKSIQDLPIIGIRPLVEIAILAIVLYVVLRFLRGSRGAGVLRGILVLIGTSIAFVFVGAFYFELEHIVWVFEKLAALSIIAGVIIFQPELRRGLLRLGINPFIGRFVRPDSPVIDEIVEACTTLSHRSIGALIAIQRKVPLAEYIESGTTLNAEVTKELIETIFYKGTILHDAGVIIVGNRVAAAGCIFPNSQNTDVSKSFGMRHRAALGMAEENDAAIVVVSEETGRISFGIEGKLTSGLTPEELRAQLTKYCLISLEGGAAAPAE